MTRALCLLLAIVALACQPEGTEDWPPVAAVSNRLPLLLAAGALSCSPRASEDVVISTECVPDQSARAESKACLVDCTRAGNPMSDEEGEDLVDACAKACADIYCTKVFWFYAFGDQVYCRAGLRPVYVNACKAAGWKA